MSRVKVAAPGKAVVRSASKAVARRSSGSSGGLVAVPVTVRAAGCLVWREVGGELEVLLVHRPRYDDWSWPKGKLDPGETLPECAVREVAEETGCAVVLGRELPGVRYRISDGRLKACHYWAARVADGDAVALRARVPVPPPDGREVDRTVWVSAARARTLLTREADTEPLDALEDEWADGVLDTRALVVLRHSRAKKRSAWKGGEDDRPLTTAGRAQADRLPPLLACYGVDRVLTSPWLRCAATVKPYAKASGRASLAVEALTEIGARERPELARAAVREVLASFAGIDGPAGSSETDGPDGAARTDVALCTHRPVLPLVLSELAQVSPRRVQAQFPRENPYLRTGELLVCHIADGHRRGIRIVAVERQWVG